MSEPTEKSRAPRRVRNELRFRPVEVLSKTFIADAFYRIEFGGEALAGFTSPGTDDHIKVFSLMRKPGSFTCRRSLKMAWCGKRACAPLRVTTRHWRLTATTSD